MNKVTFINHLNNIFDFEKPSPGFSIIIEINKKRIVEFSRGCYSDFDLKEVTSNTIYDLASITKIYTTAIIAELYYQKKIDVFLPCSHYIEVFKKSNLKIIDLLSHKANFNIKLSEYRNLYGSNFQEKILEVLPSVNPAKEIHYENLTYLFLGRIIETITNKKLEDVFICFFEKHNLLNTHLGILKNSSLNSPPTEIINGLKIINVTHDESARLCGGIAGNAGVFASVNDLVKFGNLWNDNVLLSQELRDTIFFKNYDESGMNPQGLGWWMRINDIGITNDLYSHTGYTGSLLAIKPDKKLVVGFVCNRTYYGRKNTKHKLIWEEIIKFLRANKYIK